MFIINGDVNDDVFKPIKALRPAPFKYGDIVSIEHIYGSFSSDDIKAVRNNQVVADCVPVDAKYDDGVQVFEVDLKDVKYIFVDRDLKRI